MNFLPFVILWVLLALTVLALLVWRKAVSIKEDDNLHVMGGSSVAKTDQQAAVAHQLDAIDKWGKIVTILTVVYGVILGGVYIWLSWVQNSSLGA